MLINIPLRTVKINDPFWQDTQRLISGVVLPYQWEVLNDRVTDAEPSHCIQNFKIAAGDAQGTHQGAVFQDSDIYKWIEAVAYALMIEESLTLASYADEAIEIIARAQAPDGYLNTYYMICEPDQRFQNLTEGHELYCAGHLFEAAVAYYEATGKRRLLEVAVRLADCLVRFFLPEDGNCRGYPGHPEVELALVKLYQATEIKDYLRLCSYFLESRGQAEGWRDVELARGGFRRHCGDALFSAPINYAQDHAPVRLQRKATGHAVRAMYLYSAMADIAYLTEDDELGEACLALYKNTVQCQMYVTGGIGAAAKRECFTSDYDLPNDSAYAETCASVGLMMFSTRMWRLTKDAACYDVWEKALYNTVLAGMGRDGQHFFYVNPLSVNPAVNRENPTLEHVLTSRPKWFGVACCPTNLARCVLSMGRSIYAKTPEALYVLSHIASSVSIEDLSAELARDGESFTLSIDSPAMAIMLRIPDGYELVTGQGSAQDSYMRIEHLGGQVTYRYQLMAKPRVLYAHPRIAQDAGKVCVAYGQRVYCLEEADNGPALCELALPRGAVFEKGKLDWLPEGMFALRTEGVRYCEDGWIGAYSEKAPEAKPAILTFVPYSQWNNRGEGEMCVWVNEARM